MNEPIKKLSRGFYIALFVIVGFVVLAAWPPVSTPIDGRRAQSMSSLRQIGIALRLFANEKEGKMPPSLAELQPEFLAADSLPKLRFRDRDVKTDLDWLYYPKTNFNALPDATILAASPRTMRSAGKEQRMILHCDGSVTFMPEAQFQKQLAEELSVAAP